MSSSSPDELIKRLIEGEVWTAAETSSLFAALVRGELDEILMAALLAGLPPERATVDQLEGAVQALLAAATPFPRPAGPCGDIVGTGGDGLQSLNLSTLAALTAAAAGCPIVKHGNRSISSRSGSFDLLQALGVPFEVAPEVARGQLVQHGITFLLAPAYHPGLRQAAAVRRRLRARTIFHLLGPLVNPARPDRIVLGVARPEWAPRLAEVLRGRGVAQACIVHGSGLDEVAIHGPTQLWMVGTTGIALERVEPADFGIARYPLDELVCGDPGRSHARAGDVLAGRGRPAENAAVAVNTALLLRQFGREDLRENTRLALELLRSGRPAELVRALAATTPTKDEPR